MTQLPHQSAFAGRADLATYGNNARLLFALETKLQLDDVHSAAASALTDGPDDKKCDLVYVDRDRQQIIVAQGYDSTDVTRLEAPANKAADLNTAIAWLLSRPLEELPARIQNAAADVRQALDANEISSVHLWYVHNLPESVNVSNELRTAETTLRNTIATNFAAAEVTECAAIEVGRKTLEEWYQALQAPILVADTIEVEVPGAYEVSGDNWKAAVTSVPAQLLHRLWNTHSSDLFSANVRDYLGSRRSDRNVNHGIKKTASENPRRFWAFNNGITALVNSFELIRPDDGTVKLKISGISIVNGAQTTGAIGSLPEAPAPEVMVQARFVQCTDMPTIQSIISFNNTQNVVKPTDFRSNDAIQRRLRDEFSQIPLAKYFGGRRGGEEDLIRRPPNLLPTDTCSQALASLHQDPAVAYNRKSQIWESDTLYSRYFNEQTTAQHIVFAFSLLRAVEARKVELLNQSSSSQALSESDTEQLTFLRKRGSTFLVVAAIGKCLETFMGRAIPNLTRLSFGAASPDICRGYWKPIIEVCLSFCGSLSPALDTALKNQASVTSSLNELRRMIEATKRSNATLFADFSGRIVERQ